MFRPPGYAGSPGTYRRIAGADCWESKIQPVWCQKRNTQNVQTNHRYCTVFVHFVANCTYVCWYAGRWIDNLLYLVEVQRRVGGNSIGSNSKAKTGKLQNVLVQSENWSRLNAIHCHSFPLLKALQSNPSSGSRLKPTIRQTIESITSTGSQAECLGRNQQNFESPLCFFPSSFCSYHGGDDGLHLRCFDFVTPMRPLGTYI